MYTCYFLRSVRNLLKVFYKAVSDFKSFYKIFAFFLFIEEIHGDFLLPLFSRSSIFYLNKR